MAHIRIEHDYHTDRYSHHQQNIPDWYIGFTLSGGGVITVAGKERKEHRCVRGHVFIVPPGISYEIRATSGHVWETVGCRFSPREIWTDWIGLATLDFPLFLDTSENRHIRESIESAFARMVRYANFRELSHKEQLTFNALEEAILLLTYFVKDERPVDPRIRELLSWLENHYTEPVQVEDLALKVCLSPSRLSHLFKEQTGDSIIERLTKIRLRRAEKRLLSTTSSITEIAMDSGFNSPEHFTRQFARHYNLTPVRYRKSR